MDVSIVLVALLVLAFALTHYPKPHATRVPFDVVVLLILVLLLLGGVR